MRCPFCRARNPFTTEARRTRRRRCIKPFVPSVSPWYKRRFVIVQCGWPPHPGPPRGTRVGHCTQRQQGSIATCRYVSHTVVLPVDHHLVVRVAGAFHHYTAELHHHHLRG